MVVRRVLLTHRTPLGTRIFAVTTDPRTRPTHPSRYVAPPPPGAHRRRMNCDGMISRTSRGAGLLTEALHHPSEGPITIVSPRTQNAVSGRPEHLLRRMDRYDPGTTPTQRGWNNPRPIDIVVYSFAPGVPIRKFSRVLVEVNDMQRYVIRVTRCPGNGYAGRRRRQRRRWRQLGALWERGLNSPWAFDSDRRSIDEDCGVPRCEVAYKIEIMKPKLTI